MGRSLFTAAVVTAVLAVVPSAPIAAQELPVVAGQAQLDARLLARIHSFANVRFHQSELQEIADASGGTRASGTPGYNRSAQYVARALRAADYQVRVQRFQFPFFQELADPEFEQISPNPTVYTPSDPAGFFTLQYSGSDDVEAEVEAVDVTIPPPAVPGSTSGCEAADFARFTAGNIALVQRGTCFFIDKVLNAQAAGASAVIIFNEGQADLDRVDAFTGTLGEPVGVPVIGTSFAIGADLYELSQTQPVTARVAVTALSELRMTTNVFGDTKFGSNQHVVVVGAHLDSVLEGPGINDNGSGVAVILDIAEQLSALELVTRNKVRFAFWGAEESGLLGSQHYVDSLNETQRSRIMLNLNFDMMGSPNFVRFVYDGDGSDTPDAGPPGSDRIEEVFATYFGFSGLETEPTAFDGRSDYGPFIAVGIPAGGLFSGAEGIKSAEEAQIYGGTEGVAYDFCYHQACDTFDNVNRRGLRQLGRGAAFSVLWWSFDRLPPRAPVAMVSLQSSSPRSSTEYRGPFLQK